MKKTVPNSRTKRSLEEMKALLRQRLPELRHMYGITSLEIFGSWVRGEQTKRSDLDILVEFEPARKLSLFDLVSLEQDLSSYLAVPIDLVEKSAVKPALRNRIISEAVSL